MKHVNTLCSTISEEIQDSVHNLTSIVQSILENSQDVSRRLANIEAGVGERNTYVTPDDESLLAPGDRSSVSSNKTIQTLQQSGWGKFLGLDSIVELKLQESRVYSRTLRRHSASSLPSCSTSTTGWSMLSGISLAQVSNISVLSLPLSAVELWGSRHYMQKSVQELYGTEPANQPDNSKAIKSLSGMLRQPNSIIPIIKMGTKGTFLGI